MMVKLTAKDRPGLFNDIVVVLRSLRLDIQHANIRTGNNGQRHDIFAAKVRHNIYSHRVRLQQCSVQASDGFQLLRCFYSQALGGVKLKDLQIDMFKGTISRYICYKASSLQHMG